MAETLGSLIDKITIVKLKQWHTEDQERLTSLWTQQKQLEDEIDQFFAGALSGDIPVERLTFKANKVYDRQKFGLKDNQGATLGQVVADLAQINSQVWHVQEKVYDFENIPVEEKDQIINQLAIYNLDRNKCIDQIDLLFQQQIKEKR